MTDLTHALYRNVLFYCFPHFLKFCVLLRKLIKIAYFIFANNDKRFRHYFLVWSLIINKFRKINKFRSVVPAHSP